jgi:hypothetical protein
MVKAKKCDCPCEPKSGMKVMAKKAMAEVKKLKSKFDKVSPKNKKKIIAGAIAAAGVVAGLAAVATVKNGLGKKKK